MPKMKKSASDKHQYAQYKSRFEKNTIAKLMKLVKAQPNNEPLKLKLEKYLDKGVPYIRNRKSNGHVCKGLHKELGFVKNQPSEGMKTTMKKVGLDMHWFYGTELKINHKTPNHGQSMCEQFEALGYDKKKRYVRKHKKTTR